MAPVKKLKRTASNASAKGSSSKKKQRVGGAVRTWNYTHIPPSRDELAKNGRQSGRNLITWNRPRMDEKLLLHIQYEAARHRIELPWDNIAHRLNPGSSGGAILQHLVRTRQKLLSEGHLVPPIPQKPGGPKQDPAIRGYVRKHTDREDFYTARPVDWNEPTEDRKWSLADAVNSPDAEVPAHLESGPIREYIAKNEKMTKSREFEDEKSTKYARPSRATTQKVSYTESESDEGNHDEEGSDNEAEEDDNIDVFEQGQAAHEMSINSNEGSTSVEDEIVTPSVAQRHAVAAQSGFSRAHSTPDQTGVFAHQEPVPLAPGTILVTPDGRAYSVPLNPVFSRSAEQVYGRVAQPRAPAVPVTPTPRHNLSRGAFFTADSSPFSHLDDATPMTAAAMQDHLAHWNQPEFLSMFSDPAEFDMTAEL